jgi:hypothetical protein
MRRTGRRAADFSGLQCRLDHAGDVYRYLVLEVKNVLQGAVETIGPEMGARFGLNQLRSDAHAVPTVAHQALEDVADTEIASHLLHADRSSLVRKARIASDDEQPSDTTERGDVTRERTFAPNPLRGLSVCARMQSATLAVSGNAVSQPERDEGGTRSYAPEISLPDRRIASALR